MYCNLPASSTTTCRMYQGVLQSLIMARITTEAQKMSERSRIIEQQATDLLAQTLRLDDTSARSYADRIASETDPQLLLHYALGNNEKGNPSHLASDFSRANAARWLVLASLNQPEMVSQANQLLRQSSLHPDSALITRAAMRAAMLPFLDTEVKTRLDNEEVAFDQDEAPILFKLSLLFANKFTSDTFYPGFAHITIVSQETEEEVLSDNRDPIPKSVIVLAEEHVPTTEKLAQMANVGMPHPTTRQLEDRLFHLYYGVVTPDRQAIRNSRLRRELMDYVAVRPLVRPPTWHILEADFSPTPDNASRKADREPITPSGLAYWVALRAARAHVYSTQPSQLVEAYRLIDQQLGHIINHVLDADGKSSQQTPLEKAFRESQRHDNEWNFSGRLSPLDSLIPLNPECLMAAHVIRNTALELLVRANKGEFILRRPKGVQDRMKAALFARLPQVDAGLFLHTFLHQQSETQFADLYDSRVPINGVWTDVQPLIATEVSRLNQDDLAYLGLVARGSNLFKHLQLRAETPRNANQPRDPRPQKRHDSEWN